MAISDILCIDTKGSGPERRGIENAYRELFSVGCHWMSWSQSSLLFNCPLGYSVLGMYVCLWMTAIDS